MMMLLIEARRGVDRDNCFNLTMLKEDMIFFFKKKRYQ